MAVTNTPPCVLETLVSSCVTAVAGGAKPSMHDVLRPVRYVTSWDGKD